MMTYELAKRLKEAGFPQKAEAYFVDKNTQEKDIDPNYPYHPTTQELLDECIKLSKRLNLPFDGNGKTDEELANLWFVLNKKDG